MKQAFFKIAHGGKGQCAFTRAAFANDTDCFTTTDFKVDISQDRLNLLAVRNQAHAQIINVKECVLHINEPLTGRDQDPLF